MRRPQRLRPDDPREWLNRARSDLAIARKPVKHVYLEDLCFHAQQAAEKKAIKAVLIQRNVEFPYIHDVARLLELVALAGVTVSTAVWNAETLTRFAVASRYPQNSPTAERSGLPEGGATRRNGRRLGGTAG